MVNNIEDYAATGVDYISSGAVIHQAKSVDMSLKAVIIWNQDHVKEKTAIIGRIGLLNWPQF